MLLPEIRLFLNTNCSSNCSAASNCSSFLFRIPNYVVASTSSKYPYHTSQNARLFSTVRPSGHLDKCPPRRRLILPYKDHLCLRYSQIANYSTSGTLNSPDNRSSGSKAISKARQDGQVTISLGEKVKENAKTASYGGIILLGIGVTCAMGYFILSELFSAESPNNIYTKSFKLCKANQEVLDVLGSPIKCYGEETRKGWRRHVAHQQFLYGDTKILRMRFYLEGKFNKGTVHVEKRSNAQGQYEYNYLVVDVDGYPPRRIVIDT